MSHGPKTDSDLRKGDHVTANLSLSEAPDSTQSLFDVMPQLGWLADAKGWIHYYNRCWFEYTGKSQEEMEGWGWQSVHDPDLLPSVLTRWADSIATGSPFQMVFTLRRHDGVFRWFMTHAKPIRDVSGSILHWVGINTDIDDQQRAEAALKHQWKGLEAMLVQAPAAIAIVRGREQIFEVANSAYCALVGINAESLIGQKARAVDTPIHTQEVWDILGRVHATGERFEASASSALVASPPTASAAERFFSWVGQSIAGPDSEQRVMLFAVEVTDQVRDQRKIEAHWLAEKDALQEAQDARTRLEELTELAFALTGTITPREVAEIVVELGTRYARADVCTFHALNEATGGLELLAHYGVFPDLLPKIQIISHKDGPAHTFDSIQTGKTLWVEDAEHYARVCPEVAGSKGAKHRAQAFWSAPLMVEGRAVGLLGMGFFEERHFSAAERGFVDTFSHQCAQALSRSLRREREVATRHWLATTLQSIGDAVIATGADGCITFMNAVAEQLTGWSEAEARGLDIHKVLCLYREATGERIESPVSKVLRGGVVVGLADSTIVRSRNGTETPIHDSGAPIRDEDGTLHGVVLVFRDVSVEKTAKHKQTFLTRATEVLISSLDYRETLASVAQLAVPELANWCTIHIAQPNNGAPQQVALAHADPEKIAFARALAERYPQDPDAPTGAPQVIRTGKSELYPFIPAELLEAGAKDAEHLQIMRELRLESAMVVPFRGRAGTILGAMTFIYAGSGRRYSESDLAFAEDFAARAAMAIENSQALAAVESAREREQTLRTAAERANTAKDEFLATVSHELRTPLNSILGWTMTLLMSPQPGDTERALRIVERNARAQARLIEDVLDISRITNGKLALALGPTDIGEIVKQAMEGQRPAATAKGIILSGTGIETGPAMVTMVDADRLQQVFWNLLTNALKFTGKGGVVRVTARRVGTEIAIEVSDTGEGIRPDVLAHIFDPFQQADGSTTRRHGGLGLGLALVKQLTEAHGGSVDVKSAGPGQGATFFVRIPARSITPALQTRRDTPSQPMLAVAGPPQRLDGMCLLVVDDESDPRELLTHLFSELGGEVHIAASAAEALSLLDRIKPHIIVSDIGMPGLDGYSFMRMVRSRTARTGGQIPAIALTAFSRAEDTLRALAAGFQHHLAKPVDSHELVAAIIRFADRKSASPRR